MAVTGSLGLMVLNLMTWRQQRACYGKFRLAVGFRLSSGLVGLKAVSVFGSEKGNILYEHFV